MWRLNQPLGGGVRKLPKNVNFLPLILKEMGDDLKIIHIIRDGRDVCTSLHPTTTGYHVPIVRWVNDVKDGLKYRDHKNVFILKYESLIDDFDNSLKTILDFLGEPFEDLKNFHNQSRIVKHFAWFEKIRPISNKSIARWANPEHKERIKEFNSNNDAKKLLKELYP